MTASIRFTHVVQLQPDIVPVAWETDDLIVWARLYEGYWNGFVLPAFDRDNAQKIIDWNNAANAEDPNIDSFSWDGDVIVQHLGDSRYGYENPEEACERIDPVVDDQGVMRWAIGAWSWTWSTVPQCPHCQQPIPWGTLT